MDKAAIKEILYGGISELMNNRDYFRRSSVDPKYSDWHDRGKEAALDFIEFISVEIQKAELVEIKSAAKQMTLDALKGKEV